MSICRTLVMFKSYGKIMSTWSLESSERNTVEQVLLGKSLKGTKLHGSCVFPVIRRKQGKLDGNSSFRASLWLEGRKRHIIVHGVTAYGFFGDTASSTKLLHESEPLCDCENKVHPFESTLHIAWQKPHLIFAEERFS